MTTALLAIGLIAALLALGYLCLAVLDYVWQRDVHRQIEALRRLHQADDETRQESLDRAGSLW